MAVKSIKVMQIVGSLVVVMTIWLASMSSVDCGGNKGGSDIILYNNNLVMRGGGGGKGKGKGGGSLVIAESHHGGHHGHHGHQEHHGHHGGEHHHSMDEKFLMDVIGGGEKRSSNAGGRSQTLVRSTSRPRSANSGSWEDLLMGGRGAFGR